MQNIGITYESWISMHIMITVVMMVTTQLCITQSEDVQGFTSYLRKEWKYLDDHGAYHATHLELRETFKTCYVFLTEAAKEKQWSTEKWKENKAIESFDYFRKSDKERNI